MLCGVTEDGLVGSLLKWDAVDLIDAAIEAGFGFRAVVADCLYGGHPAVQTALWNGAILYGLGRLAGAGGSRHPLPLGTGLRGG